MFDFVFTLILVFIYGQDFVKEFLTTNNFGLSFKKKNEANYTNSLKFHYFEIFDIQIYSIEEIGVFFVK